jgi:hypothetical protein
MATMALLPRSSFAFAVPPERLQARYDTGDEEDRLQVHVYRLLVDTIPMRITTLLRFFIMRGDAAERFH